MVSSLSQAEEDPCVNEAGQPMQPDIADRALATINACAYGGARGGLGQIPAIDIDHRANAMAIVVIELGVIVDVL